MAIDPAGARHRLGFDLGRTFAGFGPPHERALEDIAADLENGYITAVGAACDYRCVMTADGRIDIEATLRQRELTPSGAK